MALNNLINKIKQYAGQNPDKARQAIDKVQETVDRKTGGKYSQHIQKAGDAAESGLGLPKNQQGQVPGQQPGQQGQVPGQQPGQQAQPPNQGQQPNQQNPGTPPGV